MKGLGYTALLAATVAMAAASASAQVQISQDGRPERIFRPITGLNQNDINFLRTAAMAHMFEIQSSEIAMDKSSDPFVKEYAKEMIADHQNSLEEMKEIAHNKGVSLPTDVNWEMKHDLMHLENQTSATLDAAYENAQRSGHANASTLFKAEIRWGKDEDVRDYAVKTLPVVTMHYKMMLNHNTMMGSTQMKGGS
jgi:predicted outer membrane protein